MRFSSCIRHVALSLFESSAMKHSAPAVWSILFTSLLAAFWGAVGLGSESERIDPSGIRGTLVICGGGGLPGEIWETLREAAGGPDARLVIVPTASESADQADPTTLVRRWNKRGFASAAVLHARSRDEAGQEEFLAPLREATAIWFDGGWQSRLAERYVGTRFERELEALLARGGVVGGTSAGAAIMSRLMIARGNPQAELGVGFDLLPGAVIDQHFSQRNRKPRLLSVLAQYPGRFGLGVDEGTAVIVEGRRMRVIGESKATVCLAASPRRDATEIVLRAGQAADLTALRRAAETRRKNHFPPENLRLPEVECGSLLIVGGGRMTLAMLQKFIELAGGAEAPLVIVPTADDDPLPPDDRLTAGFRRAGAKDIRVLRARTLDEIDSPEFLHTLQRAKGVWFGGGRQWRLVDAFEGTRAETLFHEVLRRGGVIGGSSAGASIQAEYLVRGHPLGNQVMLAEGYERGLGFLHGVAIDQHFAQRNRFSDLASVVGIHPQVLGIGVDEATALIVQGRIAEVLGKHDVHFYHAPPGDSAQELRRDVVSAGQRYDLVERKMLVNEKTEDESGNGH